jgi:hypothetical protein
VRLGQHLPWVLRENIDAHWRQKSGDRPNVGSAIVYVKATLEEVAAALSIMTGEEHPLADRRLLERYTESGEQASAE